VHLTTEDKMTRSDIDEDAQAAGQDAHPMSGINAALATITAADEMNVTEGTIEIALSRSTWGSVQGMLVREFEGGYRGYYPKCGLAVPDEAAIAAVFDALAGLTGDPRRALRVPAGGRSDG
jgi:hypothetical protein